LPQARAAAKTQNINMSEQQQQEKTYSPSTTSVAVTSSSASGALASTASIPPLSLRAPRIPKSAGELRFDLHTPDELYRIYSALNGFTPLFTFFNLGGSKAERIRIVQAMHPMDVERRHQTDRRRTSPSSSSSFPSFKDAFTQGPGSLFYDDMTECIGVICRSPSGSSFSSTSSSSSSSTSVSGVSVSDVALFISHLQLASKPNPVDASTFARGYLDRDNHNRKRRTHSAKRRKDGDEDNNSVAEQQPSSTLSSASSASPSIEACPRFQPGPESTATHFLAPFLPDIDVRSCTRRTQNANAISNT